ncbi:hypothetical protein R6G71_08390 [Actinobaculum suis]|uniref:Uncharacterized protein n=1 Tax=Actinobaculum suis TaxID=1657 RepID=A0AAW9HJD4_9ACTO|nr:hypothetical protein [Actinobaculum suis]MDY5154053.1 hypothetical protein [Actinobaculum suis]
MNDFLIILGARPIDFAIIVDIGIALIVVDAVTIIIGVHANTERIRCHIVTTSDENGRVDVLIFCVLRNGEGAVLRIVELTNRAILANLVAVLITPFDMGAQRGECSTEFNFGDVAAHSGLIRQVEVGDIEADELERHQRDIDVVAGVHLLAVARSINILNTRGNRGVMRGHRLRCPGGVCRGATEKVGRVTRVVLHDVALGIFYPDVHVVDIVEILGPLALIDVVTPTNRVATVTVRLRRTRLYVVRIFL